MSVTSTKHASPHSSRSPLSGNLDLVSKVEEYVESFPRDLANTIRQVLTQGRSELTAAARRDPAWAPYADLLDLRFVQGEFHYVINGPPERVTEALNLEYGLGVPPNALLRKMAAAQGHSMASIISKRLTAAVPHA